jgi:hypothetical protein
MSSKTDTIFGHQSVVNMGIHNFPFQPPSTFRERESYAVSGIFARMTQFIARRGNSGGGIFSLLDRRQIAKKSQKMLANSNTIFSPNTSLPRNALPTVSLSPFSHQTSSVLPGISDRGHGPLLWYYKHPLIRPTLYLMS